MIVICLNGPINSGKSTIGRALADLLPDAEFVEGDDHGVPEDVEFEEMLARAVARLVRSIEESRRESLVVAYPLRQEDFARLKEASAKRGASFIVVTLAPPMDVVLKDRGERKLDDEERDRIREMYEEGYASRDFSDLIITDIESPEAMACRIRRSIPASPEVP